MANTLYEYYTSLGQRLPSVQERAQIAQQFGIPNYQGTAQQNIQMLNALQQTNQPSTQTFDREAEIKRVQTEIAQRQAELVRQQQIEAIQAQIKPIQQQVQNATIAGYGEGGRYEGQQIPEAILSGEQTVYDTGNQQLNDLVNKYSEILTKQIEAGKVVNPDIEITPEQILQFTELASKQISPYYRSQIESIKTDLSKSIENLQKQYDITKKSTEQEFKNTLSSSREQRAGVGTIFSGTRGASEQSMVEAQNRSLDLSALQTEQQIGSNLRTLEGQIGSSNLPTLPQYQTYRATTEGEGGFIPGRVINFTGTGGIEGSIQKQQREAELLRQSKYKQAAREGRSLDYYL